jgi:hypothetical protein
MSVDRESRHAERMPKHHVGRLTAHTRQSHQRIEIRRHLAIVALDKGLCHPDQ